MEVRGKCVVCGASIPLEPDDDLRIICDECKEKRRQELATETSDEIPRTVSLTPKGLALCHFAFRDGPRILGLSNEESMETAKRLIERWDGSETLLQMYQRTEQWPDEVAKV